MKSVKYIAVDTERTANRALNIYRFGIREQIPPKMVDHRRPGRDFLFMAFYDPVAVQVGDGLVEVPAGSFVVWRPEVRRCYGNTEREWNHSWLHASGSVIDSGLRRTGMVCDQPVTVGDLRAFDKYLWELYEELVTHRQPCQAILENLFANWLLALRRCLDAPADARGIPAPFLAVKQYIENHLADSLTLDNLAKQVSLSVPQFCHKFKGYFGVSAIKLLIQLRMKQAAFFLRDVNRSVTEVGREVGYGDLFYFSKLFKRHFGRSPRAFREER
ncbi:MAG: helix-turn-helix transcriptional regulator [Kiritimatiellae bacterium]|nr:helix-turn-helix transcriptional regulator [Kiritimatiellia bacterium]